LLSHDTRIKMQPNKINKVVGTSLSRQITHRFWRSLY